MFKTKAVRKRRRLLYTDTDNLDDVRFTSRVTGAAPDTLIAWWMRVRTYVTGKAGLSDANTVTVSGGDAHGALADYTTIPGGLEAVAHLYGQLAYAAGGFDGIPGSAQTSVLILRRQITSGGAVQPQLLYLDGAAKRAILENNTAWAFHIRLIVLHWSGGAQIIGFWRIEGAISRGASAAATALVAAPVVAPIAVAVGAPPAPFAAADTANGALSIYFYTTGVTGQVQRAIAAVHLLQIA